MADGNEVIDDGRLECGAGHTWSTTVVVNPQQQIWEAQDGQGRICPYCNRRGILIDRRAKELISDYNDYQKIIYTLTVLNIAIFGLHLILVNSYINNISECF